MNKFIKAGKLRPTSHTILTPESADLRLILVPISTSGKESSALFNKLMTKWGKVREDYKTWYALRTNFKLGQLHVTAVQSDVWVLQLLVKDNDKLDTASLKTALKKVYDMAKSDHGSVHVSNLMLDEVPELNTLLTEQFLSNGINVWSYVD